MKAIKLILVFIVVLGGVVLAFYYSTRADIIESNAISDSSLQQYREQFEKDWESAGDWNKDIFMRHCDLIKQLSTTNEIESLNDLNTSTAVEVIYKRIFNEWGKKNCSKNKIDKYIAAISTIEDSDNRASSNPNIKLIKEVNYVFTKAYKFSHQKFGLVPQFDGSNWNSYTVYSSGIESQKRKILEDVNYKKYLSNIYEISYALDNVTLRLSEGRKKFYNTLALEIIESYNVKLNTERTRADLNSLRNIISKYENEYGSNTSLSSFVSSYADNVYENEKQP